MFSKEESLMNVVFRIEMHKDIRIGEKTMYSKGRTICFLVDDTGWFLKSCSMKVKEKCTEK